MKLEDHDEDCQQACNQEPEYQDNNRDYLSYGHRQQWNKALPRAWIMFELETEPGREDPHENRGLRWKHLALLSLQLSLLLLLQ